uniref:Uncharacterized protein n=1 Tax=Pararge aegeria TaxID=116150 RepID=S4P918_9NEOP
MSYLCRLSTAAARPSVCNPCSMPCPRATTPRTAKTPNKAFAELSLPARISPYKATAGFGGLAKSIIRDMSLR